MRLTDTQIAAFAADGFVHVPAAVDAEGVAAVLDAVDKLQATPSRHGANVTRDGDPGAYFLDRYLYSTNPTFAGFVERLGLAELAADATRSESIRLYFDQVFVKEPGTQEEFSWHQDRPFWAIDGTQICSTWLALTAADAAGSALEFVRGSHLWGVDYRPDYPAMRGADPAVAEQHLWPGIEEHLRSYEATVLDFEDHPERYEVCSYPVEPGDVLLFDYRVVHRSRGNSAAHRRAAVSWRWLGDDATWSPKIGSDPIIKQEHTFLAPGDLVHDDDVFPVAFRRDSSIPA